MGVFFPPDCLSNHSPRVNDIYTEKSTEIRDGVFDFVAFRVNHFCKGSERVLLN